MLRNDESTLRASVPLLREYVDRVKETGVAPHILAEKALS